MPRTPLGAYDTIPVCCGRNIQGNARLGQRRKRLDGVPERTGINRDGHVTRGQYVNKADSLSVCTSTNE